MNRDLESELVPLCRELGIGIVACELSAVIALNWLR
eukprot:COSAG01_NODE_8065_length_2933_cov_26.610092_5_plen_36_part_00